MFSSATKKVTLFAAIIGVTGVVAGTSAFAVQQSAQSNGHGNSYSANQCKNGGWRELGYKNQGQCIRDMVGNENGGNNGGNNGNNGGNAIGAFFGAIGQFIGQIFASVQNGLSQAFVFFVGIFSFS